MKRGEVDTTSPFRSVKEAVTLFGEKVLATDLHPNKLRQMHRERCPGSSRIGTIEIELEATKQSLQKAREESMLMAHSLSSLQEELERTKTELQKMKRFGPDKQIMTESETEDVKTKFEVQIQPQGTEFQKQRYVTFASNPSVAEVMIPQGTERLQRQHSVRRKKKNPLTPLIGVFSKKK